MPLLWVGLQASEALARDPARDPVSWTVTSENDSPWSLMWNNAYRDEYYTNGVRLSRRQDLSGHADGLLPRFVRSLGMEQAEQLQLAVSQTMYTPIEIWETTIPASVHPYAGHLFISGGLSATREHLLGSLELLGGWTGPPALAEPAQKQVHVMFNGDEPMGWDEQVQAEPTFGTSLTLAAHELVPARDSGVELRAVPHTTLTLATTDLAAQGGFTLGFGTRGDVPALRPEQARFGHGGVDTRLRGDSKVGAAVFGVMSWRYQAHDMFLGGGTFSQIPSPELIPWVHESAIGVRVRVFGTQLLMMNNIQQKTYTTQEREHIYGTMAVSQEF